MKNPKVICLGEALVDRLGPFGGDPRIDTPVKDCLGGAPANVACGLSRLGLEVAFLGSVGNDEIGDKFQNLFISRGVNIEGLQRNEILPTRIVLVKRDISGERTFGGFVENKFNRFSDEFLQLDLLKSIWKNISKKANWLVLGTLGLASEASRDSILWVINEAKNQGINIAIDINWRPIFWDKDFSLDAPPTRDICILVKSFLEKASLIKLAEEEAIYFFESNDPCKISRYFSNNPNVVITDGSKPIKWNIDGFNGTLDSFSPAKIIDTTGAGDCFLAGLIYQLELSDLLDKDYSNLEQVVRYAAACGALACLGAGAIEPQPTSKDVEKFLGQFYEK